MSPITSVILICASALLPQDCTVDTATDMLMGLEANTPIECLMSSQALIAQSALIPARVAADHYLKVVCMPSVKIANLPIHDPIDADDHDDPDE